MTILRYNFHNCAGKKNIFQKTKYTQKKNSSTRTLCQIFSSIGLSNVEIQRVMCNLVQKSRKTEHWDNSSGKLVKVATLVCSHVLQALSFLHRKSFQNLNLFTRCQEIACFVKFQSKNHSENKRFVTLFSEITSFGGKVYMTGMVANDMRQIRIYFPKFSHHSIGHTNHSKLPQIHDKRTFSKIARELDKLE